MTIINTNKNDVIVDTVTDNIINVSLFYFVTFDLEPLLDSDLNID